MLGVFGIIISLALLMFFAYRGISVLILAPLMAMTAVILTGADIGILEAYGTQFMPALASYLAKYFPVFLVGAIFGKIMGVSGAAQSIAHTISEKIGKERAVLAVVTATGLLVYGGVSLFVVVFAIYPFGAALYREAGIPKRFLPASIALGGFTFAMTALPGTPQYINTMPIPYFGTNTFSAPVLGVILAAIEYGLGVYWITSRAKKAMAKGEGYGNHENENINSDLEKTPSFIASVSPILIVFLINLVLTKSGILAGIWPVVVALAVSIVISIFMFKPYLDDAKKTVNEGALGALLPVLNTASEVGYGGVIKSLAAFAILKAAVTSIPGPPLMSIAASTTALAGMIGSASGGTAIALEALGDTFSQIIQTNGLNPHVVHRLMIIAAGGLDTLPHCGAVITLLSVTGLTHKESYGDIAFVTMAVPLVATAIGIVLATIGIA
ncbi:MAG: GntP family permease [Firmicutes bacterium]|nr:GntP family permease [Bacillota bacterium]